MASESVYLEYLELQRELFQFDRCGWPLTDSKVARLMERDEEARRRLTPTQRSRASAYMRGLNHAADDYEAGLGILAQVGPGPYPYEVEDPD